MFIRDSIKIHEFTYKLSELEIVKILKKAQNIGLKYIGVIETQDYFIDKEIWLEKSAKFNITVIFSKEYTFKTNKSERYFLIIKNQDDYFTANRLQTLINENIYSFNCEETTEYLLRNEITLLVESNGYLMDFKTKDIVSKSPVLLLSKDVINNCAPVFLNSHNIIDIDSSSFERNPLSDTFYEKHQFKNNNNNIKMKNSSFDLRSYIDWGKLTVAQVDRLNEEILFLENSNQLVVFWISNMLKDENIKFNGSFNHFLLSNVLGLIVKEELNSKKKIPLTKDILKETFVFDCDTLTKFHALLTIKPILKEYGLHMKHPVSTHQPLFSSLISLFNSFKNQKEKDLTNLNINNLVFLKDKLDDVKGNTYVEKINAFYQEMSLYFIFHPEEKEAFDFSLNLSSLNLYHFMTNYNKSIIYEEHALPSKGETVFFDILDSHKFKLPLIQWENKKTPLFK